LGVGPQSNEKEIILSIDLHTHEVGSKKYYKKAKRYAEIEATSRHGRLVSPKGRVGVEFQIPLIQ
jgi:hypothetical protein